MKNRISLQVGNDAYFPFIGGQIVLYHRFAHCFDAPTYLNVNQIKGVEYVDPVFSKDELRINTPPPLDKITHCYFRDVPTRQHVHLLDGQFKKYVILSGLDFNICRYVPKCSTIFMCTKELIPLYSKTGINIEYMPMMMYPKIQEIPLLELKERPKDLIYFGRMSFHKNTIELIKLMYELPHKTLTLIGDANDKRCEDIMRDLISKPELKDRVTWMPAMLPTRELYEIVAQHKVFILLSKQEIFNISLLDALSLGLECVAYMPNALIYSWSRGVNLIGSLYEVCYQIKQVCSALRPVEEVRSFLFPEYTVENVRKIIEEYA